VPVSMNPQNRGSVLYATDRRTACHFWSSICPQSASCHCSLLGPGSWRNGLLNQVGTRRNATTGLRSVRQQVSECALLF
jgi:hypothetical protein